MQGASPAFWRRAAAARDAKTARMVRSVCSTSGDFGPLQQVSVLLWIVAQVVKLLGNLKQRTRCLEGFSRDRSVADTNNRERSAHILTFDKGRPLRRFGFTLHQRQQALALLKISTFGSDARFPTDQAPLAPSGYVEQADLVLTTTPCGSRPGIAKIMGTRKIRRRPTSRGGTASVV